MDLYSLLAFLGLVAIGSYVQTVSGFAIGLVITGGATAMGLAPVAFTANVVSIIAAINIAFAVHSRHSHIDLPIMVYASIGVLLLSGAGLLILHRLSSTSIDLLKTLLGAIILVSGALLMIHPRPLRRVSRGYVHFVAGSLGGLLSGMIGAGGPPLVVHLYRQPLPFAVIRTTLLAVLGVMPLIRIGIEAYGGNITAQVLKLSLMSIPVTVGVTLLARHFPPPISERWMKRLAFALLCVVGLSLMLRRG